MTFCGGRNLDDFTCNSTSTPAGDGVSSGAATNEQGNAVFASVSFGNGSITLLEVTPNLTVQNSINLDSDFLNDLLDPDMVLNPGHIDLSPYSDSVLMTGNSSDNVAILPLDRIADALEATDPADAAVIREWFVSPSIP